MENIQWKDELYAEDLLGVVDESEKPVLEKSFKLIAISIGKTEEQIRKLPLTIYTKLAEEFAKRYGFGGVSNFLGKR